MNLLKEAKRATSRCYECTAIGLGDTSDLTSFACLSDCIWRLLILGLVWFGVSDLLLWATGYQSATISLWSPAKALCSSPSHPHSLLATKTLLVQQAQASELLLADRQLAVAALKEERDRFEKLVETSPHSDLFVSAGARWRDVLCYASRKIEAIYGVSLEKLMQDASPVFAKSI